MAVEHAIHQTLDQLRRLFEYACREVSRLFAERSRERQQERPTPRVERLVNERDRIDRLWRDAQQAGLENVGDQDQVKQEPAAQAAENELDRQVRKLPMSELREFQNQEQERDREGPSR